LHPLTLFAGNTYEELNGMKYLRARTINFNEIFFENALLEENENIPLYVKTIEIKMETNLI
jgi:hypothetical protein